MAASKMSRKELNEPDEFITFSGKMISYAKENSSMLITVGVAIVAVVAIIGVLNWHSEFKNDKGLEAYNEAYAVVVQNMIQEEERDDLEGPADLFQLVLENHSSSDAADLALPQVAYLKTLERKFDEAIALYKGFLNGIPESDPRSRLTQLSLAACYEENEEYEKAIELLEILMSNQDGLFKEQSMLALSRVYRLSSNQAKSDEILNRFIEEFESSPFLSVAKANLS